MDGPRNVASGLKSFCDKNTLEFQHYPKSSDRGYYAWHSYIKIPVDLLLDGEVARKNIWFEIQITTQLAEVISELTHGLYEGIRETPADKQDDEWRWQPESQRFRSAYLGHTLHLLEGLIKMFRDDVFEIETNQATKSEMTREASNASPAPQKDVAESLIGEKE